MTTVLEQAMGLSADEKLRLIIALCNSLAKSPEHDRIDQMLLEAVDQVDRGECAPWQRGEGRKILDDVVGRHQESEVQFSEEQRERIDQMLLQSADSFDRGDYAPLRPGELEDVVKRVIERHQGKQTP